MPFPAIYSMKAFIGILLVGARADSHAFLSFRRDVDSAEMPVLALMLIAFEAYPGGSLNLSLETLSERRYTLVLVL